MNNIMVYSMTGFGRGEYKTADAEICVEIRSVNHRYSDVAIKLPRYLSFLDDRVRQYIQNRVSRGRVDVYISYDLLEHKQVEVRVNNALAQDYYNALMQLKDQTGIDDRVTLSLLAGFPDVITTKQRGPDEEYLWEQLLTALTQATDTLLEMREREGVNLKENVAAKLGIIYNSVLEIESRAQSVVTEYRQKLERRLEELARGIEMDSERLYQEVVIFADRSNIDEELVRLKSHISQTLDTLDEGGTIGRKLDFLVQEMYREINTIGSKANDLCIANGVVQVKTELEKIREQIQNIE